MPRAFINSEFAKHQSNLVTSISVTVEHLAITCVMDVKKIFCKQSSYVQQLYYECKFDNYDQPSEKKEIMNHCSHQ